VPRYRSDQITIDLPHGDKKFRLAYVATHPIQYQVPLLRFLATSGVDVKVFFLSDYSLHAHHEKAFNRTVQWDVPLDEGYSWEVLPRVAIGHSTALRPHWPVSGLKTRLAGGRFDAVWVHGWGHVGLRQAVKAANALRIPVLLRGESIPDNATSPRTWKSRLRDRFVRGLLGRVAACLCIGSWNRQFYRSFDYPEARLFQMPYAVDNHWFQARCAEATPHREKLRASLVLQPSRSVILFAAKFIPVKAPDVLLAAFQRLIATAQTSRPYLLLVGDGPMRTELEKQVASLEADVRFLGFKNQTELPALYDLCDVFVLPSRFEPWGLVVNEVMNAGKAVIVSDHVGAGPDLVKPQENGWIFPSEDVEALTKALRDAVSDASRTRVLGERSRARIGTWSFDQDREGLLSALGAVADR
jgi:glycosyltransferase involved in cell wall biosynthesis